MAIPYEEDSYIYLETQEESNIIETSMTPNKPICCWKIVGKVKKTGICESSIM
jgi:hypothetical protein